MTSPPNSWPVHLRLRRTILRATTTCACLLIVPPHATPAPAAPAPATSPAFVDHGIAAPVSESRGLLTARDPRSGRDLVVTLLMDAVAGGLRTSLLVVDAVSGQSDQYWYPEKDAAPGATYHLLHASSGKLYFMLDGTFLEFDLGRREWTFAATTKSGTAMSLAEGPDGTVYAGTYPAARLLRFNPKTRTLADLGQLDLEEHYPMDLAAGDDGWVYAGIGTARSNLVALNPATRERRQITADADRKTGAGEVYVGTDHQAYGRSSPAAPWLRLHDGTAEPLPGDPAPRAPAGNQRWSEQRTDLPSGGRVDRLDLARRTFDRVDPDGTRTTVHFDYASAGAPVTALVAGDDGRVYGGTSHPMRLFRLDPGTSPAGPPRDLGGVPAIGGGNLPDLVSLHGAIYGCSYSRGDLWRITPDAPWTSGQGDRPNPAPLGSFRPHLQRPRAILAHPDGRHLVAGGYPGYGLVGGGLLIHDLQTGQTAGLTSDQLAAPGLSPVTLALLPNGDLLLGTSTLTPGGGHPTAPAAELLVLDWPRQSVRQRLTPFPDSKGIVSLLADPAHPDLVYGLTAESQFFVYDAATNRVTHTQHLRDFGTPSAHADNSFLRDPRDGRVYLAFGRTIASIDPATLQVTPLAHTPAPIAAGGAITAGRLYFADGPHVWSYQLPTPNRGTP